MDKLNKDYDEALRRAQKSIGAGTRADKRMNPIDQLNDDLQNAGQTQTERDVFEKEVPARSWWE